MVEAMIYLIKVLLRGSHLLPRLVEELNADAEKLLQQSVLSKEDWMIVRTSLRCCGKDMSEINKRKHNAKRKQNDFAGSCDTEDWNFGC